MKKIFIYFLILVFVVSMCACSNTTDVNAEQKNNFNDKFTIINQFNWIQTNSVIDIRANDWITTTIKFYPQGSDNSVITIDYVEITALSSSHSVYMEPPVEFQNLPVLDFTETCYITPMGIIIQVVGDVHPNYISSTSGFYPWSNLNESISPLPINGYWEFE